MREATVLFEEVLRINSQNWPALWFLGKIHQRLADHDAAFQYFAQAHQINPAHPDVAREASIAAMDSGKLGEAVLFAQTALATNPSNAGLRANLALALLFSQRPAEALALAEAALRDDPTDEITASTLAVIQDVIAGRRACPKHVRELD